MKFKAGVDLRGMQPQVLVALLAAKQAYQEAGHELVITAGRDGKHKDGSLHYKGKAADLRTTTAGIGVETARAIAKRIKALLTAQFDVVVEADHIHVEFDPKEGE